MNKRERLHAAFKKEKVDRPPMALWRHFPGDDLDPTKLARHVVAFQKQYDFDFVKVTPAASYIGEAYGGDVRDAHNREGTRTHVRRAVTDWREWNRIKPLDASHAVIQRERAAIKLIRDELGGDVPILQTIFTPLSCAHTLAGERLVQDLHEHPAELHDALEQLGTTMAGFGEESINAGADAVFLATQMATSNALTEAEYRAFGVPYDLALIDALRGKADFVFLHAHGENLFFDLLAGYPVQAINWHDRKTPPTLAAGKQEFQGAVAGGIEEWGVLADGTPDQVRAQVADAIAQTEGMGLIVCAGCVISTDTPDANIRAAWEAV